MRSWQVVAVILALAAVASGLAEYSLGELLSLEHRSAQEPHR